MECTVRIDSISAYPKLERFYTEALNAFLQWLGRERLQVLAQQVHSDKALGRRGRLHRMPEAWSFGITAKPIDSDARYCEVALTVVGKGEGFDRDFSETRMWDTEQAILCPLTRFRPVSKAKNMINGHTH